MKIQREKVIAAIATTLLFGALVGSMILFRSNNRLTDGLNDEKIKSEALMNEKVALTKEIDKLKKDFTSLLGKNQVSETTISDLIAKMQDKENRIAQLTRENSTVKELKKQLTELQQFKADLEKQVSSLLDEKAKLMASNEELQNTLLALKSENTTLTLELENMKLAAADNYLIQSLKGMKNERLTVNAGRTRKLVVSFDLPKDINADLKFQVTTPSGKKVSEGDKALSWAIPTDLEMLTASLDGHGSDITVTKRVQMIYQPSEKMEKGVYTISIYNGKTYIGSCQVRLR